MIVSLLNRVGIIVANIEIAHHNKGLRDKCHTFSSNELSFYGKAASCLERILCGVLVWESQLIDGVGEIAFEIWLKYI